MKRLFFLAVGSCLVTAIQPAFAEVEAYPQKGQSEQQQSKDKYNCYEWAKKETGFDPMAASESTPPAQQAPKGGAGRSAAKGAAGGAAIGGLAGDAGKGAAAGAAAGAVGRHRAEKKQEAGAEQQQTTQVSQKKQEFDKAQGACLKGKGYSMG
jgi:outer membrane lipoprotein SlyB